MRRFSTVLICFSLYLYRDRDLVERFFNKIKQCRRVATRYDKLTTNYRQTRLHPSLAACLRGRGLGGLVRVGEGIRPTRSHAAKQPKLRGGSVKNGPPLPMIITLFLKALGKAVHQHDGPASKGCPSFGNDRQAIKTSKMYFDRFFQMRLEIIE